MVVYSKLRIFEKPVISKTSITSGCTPRKTSEPLGVAFFYMATMPLFLAFNEQCRETYAMRHKLAVALQRPKPIKPFSFTSA
jgi:hypothetical protein